MAEAIATGLATEVAKEGGKEVVGTLRRHVRYYTEYSENVKTLETLMKDLEAKRNDLTVQVEAEQRNLQEPSYQIERWLEKFEGDDVTGEFERVKEDVRKNASRRCFLSTYKIGRRVVKMIDVLRKVDLNYVAPLASRNPPRPGVEEIYTKFKPGLESMEKSKREVMDALQCEEVRTILVHGTGGVGKTTLMQSINNDLKHSPDPFKSVIMVTVSSNPDHKKLQGDIAKRLGLKLDTDDDIYIRANRLSERLEQEGSVLIILDDVWKQLDIDKLGIKRGKIVMTSRDSRIRAERKFPIRHLTNEESWNLFRTSAGEVVERDDIKPTAKDICKKCDGLPLAIEVLASGLVDEEEARMWKQHLKYLKSNEPHQIEGVEQSLFKSLKLSYDQLGTEDLKSCFLTCSLFPEDYEIKVYELTRYGIGEGFIRGGPGQTLLDDCRCLVDKLKSRGLLLEVDEWTVRMHDVVRDVALYIGTTERGFYVKENLTEWPQQEELQGRKRLSFLHSKFRELPDQPRCDAQIKTLLLMGGCLIEEIADGFFETMPNLLTLALEIRNDASLPSSIKRLENLRVCMLDNSDFNRMIVMTDLLKLRKLVVLSLRDFQIFELPEEIGELVHLKILDLTDSKITIIRPNVLSKLQQLEELYMRGSFRQWMADGEATNDVSTRASFSELGTLEKLHVLEVDVEKTMIFSQDLSTNFSERLSQFDISHDREEVFYFNGKTLKLRCGALSAAVANWVKILTGKADALSIEVFEELAVNDVVPMECFSRGLPNLEELYLHEGRNLKNAFRYMLTSIEEDMIVEETGQQKYMIDPLCPRLRFLNLYKLPEMESII